METETYQIKTRDFEGPFHLLLSLIQEKKFFINDLSLSQITEDYLNYIKQIGEIDTRQVSGFVAVAATLILIKSKSLLPSLNLSAEEEGDIKNLEDRLKLYEFYTELSAGVKKIFGKRMIFAPLPRKNAFSMFMPDQKITRENMASIILEVLGRVPKKEFLPEVEVKKVISLEEMISKLSERIEKSLEFNFKDFACLPAGRPGQSITKEEKVVVIISFLAMLELVRQGLLHVTQSENFEDIIIQKQQNGTPA